MVEAWAQMRKGAGPRFLLLTAMVIGSMVASAQAAPVPALNGPVMDRAQLLGPADRGALTDRLKHLERTTGVQLVVLTMVELDGEPIEAFSLRVAENYKLGQRGRDTGVLLVAAVKEGRFRIEVGYGLEEVLSDAVAAGLLEKLRLHRTPGAPITGMDVVALADATTAYLLERRDALPSPGAQDASPRVVDENTRNMLLALCALALLIWLTVGARKMARVPHRPLDRATSHSHQPRQRIGGWRILGDLLSIVLLSGSRRSGRDDDNYRGGGGRFGGGGASG